MADKLQRCVDITFSKAKTAGFSNPSEEFKKKLTSFILELINTDWFKEESPKIMHDFETILAQSGAVKACEFLRDKLLQYGVELAPLGEYCFERGFEEKFMSFYEQLQNTSC